MIKIPVGSGIWKEREIISQTKTAVSSASNR